MKVLCVVLAFLAVAYCDTLLGNRQSHPVGWNKLHRALPDAEISFTVALKQSNLELLENTFWAVSTPGNPLYRKFLTISDIESMIRPTEEDEIAVISWLKNHGVIDIKRDQVDSYDVKTTVDKAEEMFNTEFYVFRKEATGEEIVKQWGPYTLPEHVEGAIDLILGLADFPVERYKVKKATLEPNAIAAVIPETIFRMYGVPSSSQTPFNSSQGVIEFDGQYYSPSELQSFAREMGITIPPIPASRVVGNNVGSFPQTEATLDIQYVAGTGLGVPSWFWIESNGVWQYGFATHIFRQDPAPYVVSISYGWNEAQQCQGGIGSSECQQLGVSSEGYVNRVNTEFQKVGLRGISLVVSAGDSGVNGRTDEECRQNHFNPDFPTGSPYVTSVGATQVANPQFNIPNPPPACTGSTYNCISGGEEHSVSFSQAHFASGGGFSNVAPQPSYQSEAVNAYLSSSVNLPPRTYYNPNGRGYPDVAAFGSNCLIYTRGRLEPVGGTSASAPIFAGVLALLNEEALRKDGKPLGFANPFLYQMAKTQPRAFNDVTVGDNRCTEAGCSSSCQGFEAYRGWDPVSGLGTPNYPIMVQYLKTHL